MVEKPYILFFNDLNITNKNENIFRAKLKKYNWSLYKTSHQQIGTFHGSITLLCGKDLTVILPLLKIKPTKDKINWNSEIIYLEKNFLGLKIDKIIYSKDRLKQLVEIIRENPDQNISAIIQLIKIIDPKTLVSNNLLKTIKNQHLQLPKMLTSKSVELLSILKIKQTL